MKKSILLAILITSFPVIIYSQGFQFDWAQAYGDSGGISFPSIDTDDSGNIYLSGSFSDSIDFDPGPGVFYLSSVGLSNVFIVKLNASGSFIWAKQTSGNSGNTATNRSVVVESNSYIYLAGDFIDSVDFDPGPGQFFMHGDSERDIFLLKLDVDGNFIWARNIRGAGDDRPFAVTTDNMGNVCVTGYFMNFIDLDPGIGFDPVFSNGITDIFIAKYYPNGEQAWFKAVGGSSLDAANAITCDNNGNVITTGYFENTVDFDPDTGVYNLSYMQSDPDIFVLKLDSSGNFVWARSITGYGCWDEVFEGNQGHSIQCDEEDNVYTCGYFQCTVDFDPGPGVYNVTSNGGTDIFVHRMNSQGDFSWVKTVGGQSSSQTDVLDAAFSIDLDTSGFIYTTGYYDDLMCDFDPGPNVHYLESIGGIGFLWQLDTAGNFINAIGNGGICLQVDNSGDIYSTGPFYGLIDFNHGIGINELMAPNNKTIYLLKLGKCDFLSGSSVQTTCVEYDFNGNILTNNGIYIDTIVSYFGCDSIITLDLTIIPVDISVTQNGNTLTAGATGANYQWIDCANGNVIIPGATNPSFTTTISGDYAVIVTKNGCTDTSVCFTISNIGINKNNQSFPFTVSPNPAKDRLVVHSSVNLLSIEIYASYGQLLQTKKSNKSRVQIDISALPPGNYFIRAISREEVFVRKFVVVR